MPALNFKTQFAEAVENGTKRQTIRATRKHPIKVGDTLYLYTGMRTHACRKLGEATCASAEKIGIDQHGTVTIYTLREISECGVTRWDEKHLTNKQMQELAEADGFNTVREFVAFFNTEHSLPFYGQLITW